MSYSVALGHISKYKVYKYIKQPGFDLKFPRLKLPLYGIQMPCVCAVLGVDIQQDARNFCLLVQNEPLFVLLSRMKFGVQNNLDIFCFLYIPLLL